MRVKWNICESDEHLQNSVEHGEGSYETAEPLEGGRIVLKFASKEQMKEATAVLKEYSDLRITERRRIKHPQTTGRGTARDSLARTELETERYGSFVSL